MLIFHLFRNASLSVNISANIARKIQCYISKSKLILCEWNAFYFSEIASIDFMSHEIKQCIVFLGHPVHYSHLLQNLAHFCKLKTGSKLILKS